MRPNRRTTVEECLVITAHTMMRDAGHHTEPETPRFIRVCYTLAGCTFPLEDRLTLISTIPHFGGQRWWWQCRCGKVTAKLYLPSATGLYFRCRTCCDVTYREQSDS